jgi:GT2 family glycosyltransferase
MPPFASIIILSRNQFDSDTRPCLDSLLGDSRNREAEIIVVDNGSDQLTQNGLNKYKDISNIKIIRNTQDIGFSSANNIGIQASSGKAVVLLNNDTIVPEGAIRKMAVLLDDHPEWGGLGPVSNSVGNEQGIWTSGTRPADILLEGKEWERKAKGSFMETKQLSFFCVALPRETVDTVGLLDEHFSPIYYEDVDYCLRISILGKRLVIAEEVFVYHRGSATMSKQPEKTRRLMSTNKRKLCQKHGDVELLHKREVNLRALNAYLDKAEQAAPIISHELEFRFDNRIKIADSELPRGLLKRWKYRRRLNTIRDSWDTSLKGIKIND